MIPEPETYQQQLARMRDAAVTRATKAEAELRAAEDELKLWRQRASREAEYRERAERAEAAVALLHQGEEPYDDERLVPTPAQWIWLWNQATPDERLERAEQVIADWDRVTRCTLAHSALFARAEQAEDRIFAAETVLRRYMGCASHTAAALRMELTQILAGPPQSNPPNASVPCAGCGSPDVVYRNYKGTPLCCTCARCCPPPEAQP